MSHSSLPAMLEADSLPSGSLLRPHLGLALDVGVYHNVLDEIRDGVYFVDRDKRIVLWNRAAETITGFHRDEMLGEQCGRSSLWHVDSSGRLLCLDGCPIERAVDTGIPIEADAFLQHKRGHRIPVKMKTSPVRDQRGALVGAVEIFRCTSADQKREELINQLAELAMLDDLTLLPNRRHFDLQLDRRLAELGRFGWSFGVLMIDIDHFKQVNDLAGHQVGDEILRMVARTLSANSRGVDTVARWGGDEFAAIIANVREDELRVVADKLRAMVEASALFELDGHRRVTVSAGAAVAQTNETPIELVRRADEMLYVAKNSGRNCVCL